jgi:hypothetical protein
MSDKRQRRTENVFSFLLFLLFSLLNQSSLSLLFISRLSFVTFSASGGRQSSGQNFPLYCVVVCHVCPVSTDVSVLVSTPCTEDGTNWSHPIGGPLASLVLIPAEVMSLRRRADPAATGRRQPQKLHRGDTSNSKVFDWAVPFQKFINAIPGVCPR